MGEISQSVKVNGKRTVALFDSGATDNLISKKLSDELGLYLKGTHEFVGIDGKRRRGSISGVWVDMYGRGGSTIVVVTDLLPQDGYYLILGQQFLQDNEVILDFEKDRLMYTQHQPKMRRVGRI